MKRHHKESTIKTFRFTTDLRSVIISYGIPGSGKTVSLLTACQDFHENQGYKIFDLYGGERNEGVYWTLPSDEDEYYEKLKKALKENGTVTGELSKQYKVNLLYPNFKSLLPKKLPYKKDYVISKVFTIPFKDLEIEDAQVTVGNVGEQGKWYWSKLQDKTTKNDNSGGIPLISQKIGITNNVIYRNFIQPLCKERLLMDKYADTNLDIISEAKQKDTITVLCLEYTPRAYHQLIINYLTRKIAEYLDNGKLRQKKNIFLMREISNFFKATNDSIVEDHKKIFRDKMGDRIRMSRRGNYFLLDTQSPKEVRGMLPGTIDLTLIFRMTNGLDIKEVTEELKRLGQIKESQIKGTAYEDQRGISRLKEGECFIIEGGKPAKRTQLLLPRTMYWKKEHNFYTGLWEKKGGEWKTTEETTDNIQTKIKENHDTTKEKYKPKPKEQPTTTKTTTNPQPLNNQEPKLTQ